MVIELDDKVVAVLRQLEAEGASREIPLEHYLKLIVSAGPIGPGPDDLSMEEFDEIMDELANETDRHAPLPDDFWRGHLCGPRLMLVFVDTGVLLRLDERSDPEHGGGAARPPAVTVRGPFSGDGKPVYCRVLERLHATRDQPWRIWPIIPATLKKLRWSNGSSTSFPNRRWRMPIGGNWSCSVAFTAFKFMTLVS